MKRKQIQPTRITLGCMVEAASACSYETVRVNCSVSQALASNNDAEGQFSGK